MSYAEENPERCLKPDCPAKIPGSRWHRVRAQTEGWFFPRDQEDGAGWCPDHLPAWVKPWRARKAAKQ